MESLSRRGAAENPRPCHSATLIPGQPGAQSPRPAPAPPMAGASRPPGRALACVMPGPAGLRGTVAHGRGKRSAFSVPARNGGTVRIRTASAVAMAGAIAPATALRCPLASRGPKAPGQRPPRPRRALLARRVGRWPAVGAGGTGLRGSVPRGRGKRGAFRGPARRGNPLPRIGKRFPAGERA
jgi:hypothetical protein